MTIAPLPRATAADVAVVFLDLQTEIVKSNHTCESLEAHAGALAKLAALHRLPAIASSVPPGGAYLATVVGALPSIAPIERVFTSAFADVATVDAIAATGRRTLVLAGVASEVVVQRTALDALAAGYTVWLPSTPAAA
jgi:hypothetical protein